MSAGIANILGTHCQKYEDAAGLSYATGCFTGSETVIGNSGRVFSNVPSVVGSTRGILMNAANSSTIYGNSNTVTPPSIKSTFMIRF